MPIHSELSERSQRQSFRTAACTLLATLATHPASAEPPPIQFTGIEGIYHELSIDPSLSENAVLEFSDNLQDWIAHTPIDSENPPSSLKLPSVNQNAFARLAYSDQSIHDLVTPSANPAPRGNRLLGWDILNESPDATFADNFAIVSEIAADFYSIHFAWNELEQITANGNSVYLDPFNRLAAVNTFVEAVRDATGQPFKLSLTIRPIDATGKTIPLDLLNQSFGSETDTETADRFVALLQNHVFKIIDPAYLTSLQIGNEIDFYDTASEPATFWADYGWFLHHIRQQLSNNPQTANLPIGFTATLDGLLNASDQERAPFLALASVVDVVGITYYGFQAGTWLSDHPSTEAIAAKLTALTDLFPENPIYLQELGYQSTLLNQSSEIEQARFFRNFFSAWDAFQTEIPLVNIVRLNDLSIEQASAAALPYRVESNNPLHPYFTEYLRTLGLRTHQETGRLKPAFEIIALEVAARNWR